VLALIREGDRDDLVVDLEINRRTDVVLRDFRSVRSRQWKFWIGQTEESCAFQFGLFWSVNAIQVGRIRWPASSPVS
jgi:hypothetical protein